MTLFKIIMREFVLKVPYFWENTSWSTGINHIVKTLSGPGGKLEEDLLKTLQPLLFNVNFALVTAKVGRNKRE